MTDDPTVMRALRRACLTVPGNSIRKLTKAASFEVDEVIIDLEDAVDAGAKTEETRTKVVDAVLTLNWRCSRLAIRINATETPWFADDLKLIERVAASRLPCSVVAPKVESVDSVAAIRAACQENGSDPPLQVMIETARGLVAVEEIACKASDLHISTLIFGPGDYAASIGILEPVLGGIDKRYIGDQWHYARSRIVAAACAFGIDPIDGPFGDLEDEAGLVQSAQQARLLGFGGKWVVHPKQIATVTEAFTPTPVEIARAREVLAALGTGDGALTHRGQMVDAATRRMAERVLESAEPRGERGVC